MLRSGHTSRARRGHAGFTLIESLTAILVLALGVAGLAWTQARLLVDGRHANARATAILLIGDLSDRMLFNQRVAASGGYRLAWGEAPAARDCTSACSGNELAQSDLSAWRSAVSSTLPMGNASVFRSSDDQQQIGIAIAWPMSDGRAADTAPAAYRGPFAVTAATHGVDCPALHHCHVAYVRH